jgi:hypothetical protein
VLANRLATQVVKSAMAESGTKNITWTGWFSDSQCASALAASGTFSATNPDCAKTCIEKGSAAVFISEQAKAIFRVTDYPSDYPSVVEDLGYHVEVTAAVDEGAKTISIQSVKRLAYEGASCARPRKTGGKP